MSFLFVFFLLLGADAAQRHCRLKHNGNIQVIENKGTEDDGPELSRDGDSPLRSFAAAAVAAAAAAAAAHRKPAAKTAAHLGITIEEDSMGDSSRHITNLGPFH